MSDSFISKSIQSDSYPAEGERYQRGWQALLDITGEQGMARIEKLHAHAPALCDMIVGFAYGEVYTRSALNIRDRMIVTVTSLLTQGDTKQLRVHLQSGIRAGLTTEQLMEIMLHCIPYIGFPRVMNGVDLLLDVSSDAE